jgi:predicted dehydrogenase
MQVAVFGLGYWGTNWIRAICQIPQITRVVGVDPRRDARRMVREHYPGVLTTNDGRRVLDDPTIDAIVIATPAATHYGLARECLRAGKHVLVEKPAATGIREAEQLVAEATQQRVILMVGHISLFTPEMQCVQELIARGEVGTLLSFDARFGNWGIVRSDTTVLWDVAPHPLALFTALFDERVTVVQACGLTQRLGRLDTCHIMLQTSSGAIGHVAVSWRSPIKTRQWEVGGTRGTVIVDEMALSQRVRVFQVDSDSLMQGARRPIIQVPRLDSIEPLKKELDHFLSAINGGPCATDGSHLLKVTELLDRVETIIGRSR